MVTESALLPTDEAVDEFLRGLGFRGVGEAMLLRGGANNRVYRVAAEDGGAAVLKVYFRRGGDMWDRFAAESEFYRYAMPRAAGLLPEPLAWNGELRAGVFEWLDAEGFVGCAIGESEVARAAEFVRRLQAGREHAGLGVGAEAVFSGEEHSRLIAGRVERLRGMEATDELSAEALRFVREELEPRWRAMEERVREVEALGIGDRCVSPSDFGFHNALRRDRRMWFIDFEYAGIDDPAKLVCDFFWQPAVPVPRELLGRFLSDLGGCLGDASTLAERVERLLPAFGIKWCCIVLNDFLRTDRARREFALGSAEEAERRRGRQLKLAREMVRRI